MLQASELALDCGAAAVEAAPIVGLARDARFTVAAVPAKRDDRHHVAVGALRVDADVVVAHIHRNGCGRETASTNSVEQRGDVHRLMAAGRLYLPCER